MFFGVVIGVNSPSNGRGSMAGFYEAGTIGVSPVTRGFQIVIFVQSGSGEEERRKKVFLDPNHMEILVGNVRKVVQIGFRDVLVPADALRRILDVTTVICDRLDVA